MTKINFITTTRIGRQYVQCSVEEKNVLILKRFVRILFSSPIFETNMLRIYATNKASPSLRRMICLLTSKSHSEEPSDQ